MINIARVKRGLQALAETSPGIIEADEIDAARDALVIIDRWETLLSYICRGHSLTSVQVKARGQRRVTIGPW